MGKRFQKNRASWVRLIVAAALVVACPVLMLVFSQFGPALFPAYRNFSKALIVMQAGIASVVPCAIWDVGVVALVCAAIVTLVVRIRRKKPLLPWVSVALLVPAAALFLFVAGWALNHYAPPLAAELDLEVDRYSTEELADATQWYLSRASELAPLVPREADGTLARQDFYELARRAGASYANLARENEVFSGSSAPVKSLLLWGEPLLYSGYVGMFFSPTGESGVPLNCAVADMPFTMCHEAAHRLAIASEEEANFAAFLACSTSDDVRFAYSGYLNAFIYCFNALYRADPDRAEQLVGVIAESDFRDGAVLVFADWADTREHYDAYESKFEVVGDSVNEAYLTSFGESEGVRSYGLVVDYLIAWHKSGRAS